VKCSKGHEMKHFNRKPDAYLMRQETIFSKCSKCDKDLTNSCAASCGIFHCITCEEDYCRNCSDKILFPSKEEMSCLDGMQIPSMNRKIS